MKRIFALGLFLAFLACSNENSGQTSISPVNKKDSLLRVLTYGLSPWRGAADVWIAKQYGFCYYPVSGCIVTKELKDSIDNENEKVYQVLARQYGPGWKQAYTRKVDSLSALFEQVKEVVKSQSNIQQAGHLHDTLYYHVAPADSTHVFDVQAFRSNDNKLAYQFKVNLQTLQVNRVQ